MHSTPIAALEVILMLLALGIYIKGEAKQATYRLNCSGEFTRARFGHSEVFEKMSSEWPSLLAPGDKIFPIIAFGIRRFLVELPPRSSWLSQETSEILPSDGMIFIQGGCWGVFGYFRECYALGSLDTVFQTEIYAILACSDYFRNANMHKMMICICSDSRGSASIRSGSTLLNPLIHIDNTSRNLAAPHKIIKKMNEVSIRNFYASRISIKKKIHAFNQYFLYSRK
jgi:hypothetical protein